MAFAFAGIQSQQVKKPQGIEIASFETKEGRINLGVFQRKMPMFDIAHVIAGINRENKTSIKMLSPKSAARIMSEKLMDFSRFMSDSFGEGYNSEFVFPVDTFLGYEKAGELIPLGGIKVRNDDANYGALFPTYVHHETPTNAVVIKNFGTGDFDVYSGPEVVIKLGSTQDGRKRISPLKGFPEQSGEFSIDTKTLLPFEKPEESIIGEFQRDENSYVGYVTVIFDSGLDNVPKFAAKRQFTKSCWLVVEIPKNDLDKIALANETEK